MDLRIAAVALLVGCATNQEGTGLEASTASDVEELAREVDAGTVGVDHATPDVDASGSVSGVGDCEWGWSVTGPVDGAAFRSDIGNAPCGGQIVGVDATVDYEVQAGAITGTAAWDGAQWSYDLTGSRTANTTITSLRSGRAKTYQGNWTLDSLTGTSDGERSGPFDASLRYTGWFGGDWSLDWSRHDDGTVEGALTGPRGSSCAISGTSDAIEVSCNRASYSE